MLHIIISPAYVKGKRIHGRFVATLAGRQLCTSREPLLAVSRILLAEGSDPETPFAARHGRSADPDGHSSGRSSTCSRTRAAS